MLYERTLYKYGVAGPSGLRWVPEIPTKPGTLFVAEFVLQEFVIGPASEIVSQEWA